MRRVDDRNFASRSRSGACRHQYTGERTRIDFSYVMHNAFSLENVMHNAFSLENVMHNAFSLENVMHNAFLLENVMHNAFSLEKLNIKVVDSFVHTGLPSASEYEEMKKAQKDNQHFLGIPRR